MNIYKKQIQLIFKETKQISCPAFDGDLILFNAKGINHLLYKGNRSKRDISRIQTNIRLLPRAIKVLRLMPFFQEESGYEKDEILFKYWAFEAVVEGRRVMEKRPFWNFKCQK